MSLEAILINNSKAFMVNWFIGTLSSTWRSSDWDVMQDTKVFGKDSNNAVDITVDIII